MGWCFRVTSVAALLPALSVSHNRWHWLKTQCDALCQCFDIWCICVFNVLFQEPKSPHSIQLRIAVTKFGKILMS